MDHNTLQVTLAAPLSLYLPISEQRKTTVWPSGTVMSPLIRLPRASEMAAIFDIKKGNF
jgi:hypothetical protein